MRTGRTIKRKARRRWMDSLADWIKMGIKKVTGMAEDRQRWKDVQHAVNPERTTLDTDDDREDKINESDT